MKTAIYRRHPDGAPLTASYDELGPCRMCGRPVGGASTSGTDVCPACDCGLTPAPAPAEFPSWPLGAFIRAHHPREGEPHIAWVREYLGDWSTPC